MKSLLIFSKKEFDEVTFDICKKESFKTFSIEFPSLKKKKFVLNSGSFLKILLSKIKKIISLYIKKSEMNLKKTF